MKLAIFLNRLNNHQVHLADELYAILGNEFVFVELCPPNEGSKKGDTVDYSLRPYLIQSWKNLQYKEYANQIALNAEACVFGTIYSLPFQRMRLKANKLSFEVSERWLKKGIINVFSPTIAKYLFYHYVDGWRNKPVYKLCSSAFAARDHSLLHTFRGRCYKWGYFTKVTSNIALQEMSPENRIVRIMWCARFLKLKHPELPILMARSLKDKGYRFELDYYGAGDELAPTKKLSETFELQDRVFFHGAVPNSEVIQAMRNHDILLFTSNRLEGWGAVVNEAMSNFCVVVGNDMIGSVPFLIQDKITGLKYHETSESLTEKVEWLLNHPAEMQIMKDNSYRQMQTLWSPANAAKSLLQLIDDIQGCRPCSAIEGPCSIAEII